MDAIDTESLQNRNADEPEITLETLLNTAWKAPQGWERPHWFVDEPCPPSLPMHKDRLEWCITMLGWSLAELAYRVHTNESSVRQWQKGRRPIPDPLNVFLEEAVARLLGGRLMPQGWRAKPAFVIEHL